MRIYKTTKQTNTTTTKTTTKNKNKITKTNKGESLQKQKNNQTKENSKILYNHIFVVPFKGVVKLAAGVPQVTYWSGQSRQHTCFIV